ncbi:MAG TPA: alpha/beta fold hydrolase [Dongiaceae bacterium]|nr:alpha/beta fold hydrolase [Dongiaceae bacterium]
MDAVIQHPQTHAAASPPETNTFRFTREHFNPASVYAPPVSELEHQLTALWEAVLNFDGIGIDDAFFEVGGESFAAVTLFTEMERFLGEMPPLSILLDYPTIRLLAGYLEQEGAAKHGLVSPVRAQGQRPVALFSTHAGHGNVLFVRRLLAHIGAEQRLYAIRARGLQEGETPHRDFAAMAADYVDEVRRVQPDGPYLLSGNCVGGIIAFEMAHRLGDLGHDVAGVVMIDPEYHPNAVPWLYWRDPEAPAARRRRALLRAIWFLRRKIRHYRDRLMNRPVIEYPAETGDNRRRQDAVMAGLGAALKAYRPRRYDGRVVILCSAERHRYLANAALGWRAFAPNVEFIEIGGSHDEVFIDALPALGKALDGVLVQAQPVIQQYQQPSQHRAAAE